MFRPATVAAVVGELKFGVATRWRDLSFRRSERRSLLNVMVTAVYGVGMCRRPTLACCSRRRRAPRCSRADSSTGLRRSPTTSSSIPPRRSHRPGGARRAVQRTTSRRLVTGLALTSILGVCFAGLLCRPRSLIENSGLSLSRDARAPKGLDRRERAGSSEREHFEIGDVNRLGQTESRFVPAVRAVQRIEL